VNPRRTRRLPRSATNSRRLPPMKISTLGRKSYWIYVAVFVVLKIGITVTLTLAPQSLHLLSHIDTPIIIGLAVVVGARFSDIGWPRWLGIGLIVLIMLVFPVLLVFLAPTGRRHSDDPFDSMPDLAWISTVALLVLLIVAGLTRGSSDRRDEALGSDIK
jgi:hypothetical protein